MTASSLLIARGFVGLKSGYTHGYSLLQQRVQSKNSWQKKIHMGQNPERSDTGFQVPPQQGSYKTYSLSRHRTLCGMSPFKGVSSSLRVQGFYAGLVA